MNGLLLAAGLGTRFRPYTEKLAKPAIPLLNVPLALYNLHLLQQISLEKIVFNTHHLPHTVENMFKGLENVNVEVSFSHEEKEILGTGGAIKFARKNLEGSGTFCMANADVVNVFSLRDVLSFHHGHQPLATMVVMKHPQAGKKYGAVWVNSKKEVVGIGKEKPNVECEPFHFIGVHFIEESIFKYIPDGPCDINKDIYMKAIANGETVLAFEKSGLWYDCGNLKDYLEATSDLLKLLPRLQHQPFFLSLFRRFWANYDKRPNIWEGEHCDHLLELGVNHMTLMDRNCKIHGSCKVNGFAVFGENAIVEKNVVLENVVVGSNVTVKPGNYKNTLLL